MIAFSVLAYLTRPEGLILLVALLATLGMLSFHPSLRLPAAHRGWAIAVLLLGPLLAAGPFMILKGGISTKPSITRILGLAPRAHPLAVERERPLDPDQTAAKTVFLATKAMLRAVEGATTLPLLLLAPLGIAAGWSSSEGRRYWLLLGTIVGLSALAMTRLHATAGYCTPRHAMVAAWMLIPAAAAGLNRLIGSAGRARCNSLGDWRRRTHLRPASGPRSSGAVSSSGGRRPSPSSIRATRATVKRESGSHRRLVERTHDRSQRVLTLLCGETRLYIRNARAGSPRPGGPVGRRT